jgi:hypothetical protein
MIERHEVLALLSRHVGREAGISVRDIVTRITGIHYPDEHLERRVRRMVADLRGEDGIAICAHPRDGYYLAATAEELDECCQFLRARAMHSLTLEARLKKIPLGELLGQLRLPT